MISVYGRLLRIQKLIALLVKADITPNSMKFADFVHGKVATTFGFTKETGREYLDSILAAWRQDRWNGLIEKNPFLTKQEKEAWNKNNSKGT